MYKLYNSFVQKFKWFLIFCQDYYIIIHDIGNIPHMYPRFVLASTVISKIRMQEQHHTFCFKIVGLVPSAVLMVKGQWCRSQVHE